jgi:transcriptional regulator with XRE-family HTH domain
METSNSILLSKAQKVLIILGENIKLARLRRKYTTQRVAERADISRPTLLSIEKGNPNVSIGAYVKVLFVLGLGKDIQKVAYDDVQGREIQDARLLKKKRAPGTRLILT